MLFFSKIKEKIETGVGLDKKIAQFLIEYNLAGPDFIH